jgi:lysine 6-dehydrogenase
VKILVLGSGLIGGPMAVDLATDPSLTITVADINADALARIGKRSNIETTRCDVRNRHTLRELIRRNDVVLSAVPGFLGFETLRSIIEAGKNVVDIAFFPEDPYLLDDLAKRNGVTAIVDCGVCPGMSGILVGHAQKMLDVIENVLICVGGLPQVRTWPYEYKAVFSPVDVIEEYTRPARFIENGKQVVRPALTDPEQMFFPGIGTLEAFNTDGLRTLLRNIRATNMKEKTLRYPGHIEIMAVLRETGFFGKDPVTVGGVPIRPLDVTAALLFPKWKMGEHEGDVTVMRVTVTGTKEGRYNGVQYDLVDRYDPVTQTLSMARTTGYTATSAVRMLKAGLFSRTGIVAPEFIGEQPECVRFMLKELAERGVVYTESKPPEVA